MAPKPEKEISSKPRTSSGASTSSSGRSRDGRFLPGTVLAGRYRVVAVLGKGGMGEVYRADDLLLEQPVALKFLPESVDKDEDALERFRNEIRVARRVSHPNVCRVYDVGEVDGLTFLSMEYVDGEDLTSLLRRIGRLVGDRALEIARQICAGLGAAHREGVLHRDLKPANIMLDGRGRVVITDFGLASLAERVEGFEARNGTPAYMAPEQLAGQEATALSDVYSLGLVLYEIFTGKRAFAADTLAEMVKQRSHLPLSTPSTWVKDLDPAVERVILRCLEADPAKRPTGALAVAAALPGGDPLAEALAAGETPSPQMVAAAGETTGLAPRVAVASLAAVVLGLAAVVFIGLKVSGLELMNGLLPPEVLDQKARESIEKLGYSPSAVDHAAMYDYNTDFTDYVHEHSRPRPDWPKVLAQRPQVLTYQYRQSPTYLDPGRLNLFMSPGVVTFDDPPPIQSGMINIVVDAQGRLSFFQAIPDEVEPNPPPAHPVDWKPLLVAAGLDPSQLKSAEPTRLSLAAFDERAAWTGTWPGSEYPLRVEAAAWRGKPVFFDLIGPWSSPRRSQHESQTRGQHASDVIGLVLLILLLGGGALMARRNYAQGKSDIRGAFRLASAMFLIEIALWVCLNHFLPTIATFGHFTTALAMAIFAAGVTWVLYVALEPYVRRRWPHAIISWSRLLAGKLRDPLVGRDLLWGVLLGVLWSVIVGVGFLFLKREGATPQLPTAELLLGSREVLASWIENIDQSILGTLQFFFLMFVLRVVLRNKWLALVCFVGIFTAMNTLRSDHPQIVWPFWLMVYTLAAVAVNRFGLIVLAAAIFTANILLNLPYSLDFSIWYATHAAAMVAGCLALAAWGFYTSLGGQAMWKDELFD
jgi:serine/threonine-protein kinase